MVKSKNCRKTFKDTELHRTSKKEEEEEDTNMPVFFYMPDVKPYGVLCQWHISPLTIPLRSLAFLKRGHMSVQDWIASIKTLWTSLPQPLRSDNPKALHFTCAEQAHMLCKALFFSDFPTATRIMLAPHPREQKKLAKEIEADQVAVEEWHAIGQEVAEMVNYAKFTQQGRLKAPGAEFRVMLNSEINDIPKKNQISDFAFPYEIPTPPSKLSD
ncbi:hypothetical protein EG327_011722 [Venturia inaequalis]|uniref:NADAR domain-containing protein n=1 Tax=Venturia inaequalis TaxID=5025 RepID=A0A8H3ZA79_VENIN|nr:hypothetical protein EG327_011722 [Venturia inaequalis]